MGEIMGDKYSYNEIDKIEDAFRDLVNAIDVMWLWGENAKDPMGNFMPSEFLDKAKYDLAKLQRELRQLLIMSRSGKDIFSDSPSWEYSTSTSEKQRK